MLAVNAVGDAFAFVAPFGDGWYRVFAWDRPPPAARHRAADLDEVRDVTRRALGTDFGMHDARWMSRFHSDERQVPHYRVGRVFLAGDAAHVHSPAGGQGMNTGLQDAANLGWKLAAAAQGWAPDGLLDTYQTERHPVGELVLRSSGAIIRMAMIQSRAGRLARNLLGGAAAAAPADGPQGRRHGLRHRHRLPATRPGAADVALRDSRRLYEVLRDGTVRPRGAGRGRGERTLRGRVVLAPPPTPRRPGRWSGRTPTSPGAAHPPRSTPHSTRPV